MKTCLDQKTEETNILRWLAMKENDSNSIRPVGSPVPLEFSCLIGSRFPSLLEHFINRCQETGPQYFQVGLSHENTVYRKIISQFTDFLAL